MISKEYYSVAEILDQMIKDIFSRKITDVVEQSSVKLPNAWKFYELRKKDPLFTNWENTQRDTAENIYIKTYLRK